MPPPKTEVGDELDLEPLPPQGEGPRRAEAVGGAGGRRPVRARAAQRDGAHRRGLAARSWSTPEDEEFLGIPGLLTPAQTAELLAKRDDELRLRIAASHRDDDERLHARRGPPRRGRRRPLVARRRRAPPGDQPAGQPGRRRGPRSRTPWCTPSCASRCPDRRRRRRRSTSSAPAASASARCSDVRTASVSVAGYPLSARSRTRRASAASRARSSSDRRTDRPADSRDASSVPSGVCHATLLIRDEAGHRDAGTAVE